MKLTNTRAGCLLSETQDKEAAGLTKKEAARYRGSLHKVQIYWTLGLAVFRHPKAH